jgi:putative nucleotidyltransferase with HDIG domain
MKASADIRQTTDLRRRIFQIERLAALPQVVWQLVEALGDDRTNANDLARLIETDAALSTKILSLANSSFYGLSQRVTTISRAVVVIGYDELQILALGAGLCGMFDLDKCPRGFDGQALWVHSLATSWVSKMFALAAGHPVPAEVMVAGLLHDLGKLLMAGYFQEELTQVLRLTQNGVPYFLAEEDLGVDHSTLGYWLARRWGLPEVHVSVIRDHHRLITGDPYFTTTCLVFLADGLVKTLGYGLVQEARPLSKTMALEAVGLTPKDYRLVATSAQQKVPDILEVWQRMFGRNGLN